MNDDVSFRHTRRPHDPAEDRVHHSFFINHIQIRHKHSKGKIIFAAFDDGVRTSSRDYAISADDVLTYPMGQAFYKAIEDELYFVVYGSRRNKRPAAEVAQPSNLPGKPVEPFSADDFQHVNLED